MSRVATKSILSLAALLFIGLSAGNAYADGIVLVSPNPCFPAGVGRGCVRLAGLGSALGSGVPRSSVVVV